MREYLAQWRTGKGDTFELGRVTARHSWDASHEAHVRWPFVPIGHLSLVGLSRGEEPRRRGFSDPEAARRASALAHAPEPEVRRQAAMRRKREQAKPLTRGQKMWRDNMRRRKRANPRPDSRRDGG
jgi:hypothetical protein